MALPLLNATRRRRITRASFARACGVCTAFLVAFLLGSDLRVAPQGGDASDDGSHASTRPAIGEETVLILIVSTRCSWCADPELPSYWGEIVERFVAKRSGADLSVVGIAEAANPKEGFEFLSAFGSFNEISAGPARTGGLLHYMINDLRGPVAYPQVLVVEREFAMRKDGSIYRKNEVMRQRLVGLAAIGAAAGRSTRRSTARPWQ